jgi:allophanate hydrolase subunit 2
LRFPHIGIGAVDHVVDRVLQFANQAGGGDADDSGLEVALVDFPAEIDAASYFGVAAGTARIKE